MADKKIRFSIIIPVKEINDYVREFVPKILSQEPKNFEIIILPDDRFDEKFPARIVSTGKAGPAKKRDIGAKKARGEILVFIDDDAYPDKNWIKNAEEIFEDKNVAAVGGPNLTPPKSNYFQKLSGRVLSSFVVSGPESYRYKPTKVRESYDLPSCNFFVRKSVFEKVGGFSTEFWPGEDTKLCLDIKRLGQKILYAPEIVVFHHRRKDLNGYLKQIGTYATHRGFFAKKYPETSRKISYFVPSAFVLGLILGPILSLFWMTAMIVYLGVLSIYFLILIIEGIRAEKIFFLDFVSLTFMTHIIYGLEFLKGIFKQDLKSKYR